MTDLKVNAQKIVIEKNQGLTQALKKQVESNPNSVLSDGKITVAEWDKTMDKLAELNEKRKQEGKASIFRGETDKTKAGWHTSFLVDEGQQIEFTAEEMKELYEAMGVTINETPAENRPAEGEYTDNIGKYTVNHNEDGGYTRTYEKGNIHNYDADGKWVSGKSEDGLEYTVHKEDDARVFQYKNGTKHEEYKDGKVRHYDADGKWVGGKDKDGRYYDITHNEDGSLVVKFNDGEKWKFDKDGKETKLADATAESDETPAA